MSQLLSNDIITLRALEPTDLDTLYQWENDTALWVVSNTAAPYSREALWHYLEQYTGDIYAQRQLRLMVTLNQDGTPVGTVDFLNFDPLNNRAELGLFIAPEHRGKGLRQLYVFIAVDNEVCLNLFEDYGYRRVGTINSWVKRGNTYRDVALLQMVF